MQVTLTDEEAQVLAYAVKGGSSALMSISRPTRDPSKTDLLGRCVA